MKTFAKIGSCVSADAFNWMNINEYTLKYNHLGLTVESLLRKNNLKIEDSDIYANNAFEVKIQNFLYQHEEFEKYISTLSSDYFIFDFGDERLPCQTWELESSKGIVPITWNVYCTSRNIRDNSKYNIKISDWHLANRNIGLYEQNIKKFISIVKKYYDDDHIIYLGLRQAEEYIDRETNRVRVFKHDENPSIEKDEIRIKQQKVIDDAERFLFKYAPDIWKIQSPKNLLADEYHHFKLHPLHFHHYIYEYYAKCITLISDYTTSGLVTKKKIYINMNISRNTTEIKLKEIRDLYSDNNS